MEHNDTLQYFYVILIMVYDINFTVYNLCLKQELSTIPKLQSCNNKVHAHNLDLNCSTRWLHAFNNLLTTMGNIVKIMY